MRDEEKPEVKNEAIRLVKEIIETKQGERLTIWKKAVQKLADNKDVQRALSAAVNATVGSYIKLSAEAIKGKTVEGQELTPLGRVMDVFIVGTGIGGYALGATGNLPAGAVSYGASWVGWGAMYGPDILTPVIKKAGDTLETSSKSPVALGMLRSVEHSLQNLKGVWFKDVSNKQ